MAEMTDADLNELMRLVPKFLREGKHLRVWDGRFQVIDDESLEILAELDSVMELYHYAFPQEDEEVG